VTVDSIKVNHAFEFYGKYFIALTPNLLRQPITFVNIHLQIAEQWIERVMLEGRRNPDGLRVMARRDFDGVNWLDVIFIVDQTKFF